MWQKYIFGYTTTKYKSPKDSSLRSKVVKPEPKAEKKWKPPSYKNYNWGVGVGK